MGGFGKEWSEEMGNAWHWSPPSSFLCPLQTLVINYRTLVECWLGLRFHLKCQVESIGYITLSAMEERIYLLSLCLIQVFKSNSLLNMKKKCRVTFLVWMAPLSFLNPSFQPQFFSLWYVPSSCLFRIYLIIQVIFLVDSLYSNWR